MYLWWILNLIEMRYIKLIFVLFFVSSTTATLLSQGFKEPSAGKAVVYFVKVTNYGGSTSFEYFHNDKYIGIFKKKNYLRYECDPGEQLFWASSENKEFLAANLKEGGTYIVITDVIMGFWKAHVGLTPIDENDKETFDRAKDLINSKPPIVMDESKIEKMNTKLKKFIKKELEFYEEESKFKHNFKHISADMAIPVEMLH